MRTVTFEQFGRIMETKGRKSIEALDVAMHRGMHVALAREARSKSPVKRSRGGREAGVFRRSWGSSVGSASRGGPVSAALSGLRPGVRSHIVNVAPHAIVLEEPGTRREGPRAGSRYGSPQAPRGVMKPAVEKLSTIEGRLVAAAIRKAERVLR